MSNLAYSFESGGGAQQAADNGISGMPTALLNNPQAVSALSPYFSGYGAQSSQAANVGQAGGAPYSAAQSGLLSQLQAQANGAGPNLAGQQLQQGTQANIAAQMATAAGQRGNQNPGAAEYNLANQAAATRQQAAGQAAMAAGQQQLGAEGALGNLTGQGVNQAAQQASLNQQTALANQAAANQAGQFNAQGQQNFYNALQGGQENYNSTVAGLLGAQGQTGNSLLTGGTNALSALGGIGGSGGGGLADGGVVEGPQRPLVGEAGMEVVMPTEKEHLSNFLQTLHAKASADPEMKKSILEALQASVKTIKKAG